MRAPDFWWRAPGLASAVLAPAGWLSGAVAGRRLAQPGIRADVPVICVGNFTVGGSGKTPVALALREMLVAAGSRPAFLTRGYGGRLRGPVVVDPARHDSRAVGDEALLLARAGPTVVSRDRPAGAALAAGEGADVVVMDDGLQNPALAKDLVFAVFDAGVGIGNGRVLPAGPLRAPLAAQWRRIDAVILVGEGEAGEAMARVAAARAIPVLRARLLPDPATAAGLAGTRVLAFAGIGRPSKFFETLRALGADLVAVRSFPDHHAFTSGEILELLAEAAGAGLVPVTTEKDAVRLAALVPPPAGSPPAGPAPAGLAAIRVLPVRLVFDAPDRVRDLLHAAIAARAG